MSGRRDDVMTPVRKQETNSRCVSHEKKGQQSSKRWEAIQKKPQNRGLFLSSFYMYVLTVLLVLWRAVILFVALAFAGSRHPFKWWATQKQDFDRASGTSDTLCSSSHQELLRSVLFCFERQTANSLFVTWQSYLLVVNISLWMMMSRVLSELAYTH